MKFARKEIVVDRERDLSVESSLLVLNRLVVHRSTSDILALDCVVSFRAVSEAKTSDVS